MLRDSKQTAMGDELVASRARRIWRRIRDDSGAVAIEYVIVAIALLAIAGAIAAALTTLGNDAAEQIPGSVSEAGGG